jgi:hypothetical protein
MVCTPALLALKTSFWGTTRRKESAVLLVSFNRILFVVTPSPVTLKSTCLDFTAERSVVIMDVPLSV